MGAVSVSGVPLSMNIDVDSSLISAKTTALSNGIEELDNGASNLNSGVKSFE